MPSEPQDAAVTADDLPEQLRIRRDKRERLLARGEEAYPVAIERSHSLAAVHAEHPDLEAGEETQDRVAVVGRVVFVRNTGKLCFATLQDGDGTRLQAMLSLAEVGEERLAQWKEDVDLGDHIALAGRVIKSRRGELSVLADSWTMAAKALRPLPILHAELSEESRVRQRHVDLIVREDARRVVRLRAAVMASLRATFAEEDYLELETPMLQTMHGGAAARPFSTHMNAYDMELFLRIARKLFLKRALVGGLHRVFEINRNFRNEGADSTHSPEFAMLEAYQAFGDYHSIADLTRRLIQNAAWAATGSHIVELADGEQYDLGGEWRWMSMYESLSEAAGVTITPETSVADLQAMADEAELSIDPRAVNHGKLVEELWEHHCSDQLHAPTFVTDFPVETSPLTRSHRDKPGVVEKWDLYVRGFELATGYSELVDPVVQRERFEAQARAGEAGDEEAMRLDEDFLAAMEQGMPPAGGMGMGMDRLLMAITGLGIRETILFPLVKPIEG